MNDRPEYPQNMLYQGYSRDRQEGFINAHAFVLAAGEDDACHN
jgi:hypothetical protein